MLWRKTLAPITSTPLSASSRWRLMVDGLVAPRCACSFWELMGRKKAEDETEGTWLRLAALAGRPVLVEFPPVLPAILARFPDSPRRSGVGCDHPGLCDAIADLAVPVCDACRLSLCGSCARPSSVPISVIREDMMLGGPLAVGYWGKVSVSTSASAPVSGELALEPSLEAMAQSAV